MRSDCFFRLLFAASRAHILDHVGSSVPHSKWACERNPRWETMERSRSQLARRALVKLA